MKDEVFERSGFRVLRLAGGLIKSDPVGVRGLLLSFLGLV